MASKADLLRILQESETRIVNAMVQAERREADEALEAIRELERRPEYMAAKEAADTAQETLWKAQQRGRDALRRLRWRVMKEGASAENVGEIEFFLSQITEED